MAEDRLRIGKDPRASHNGSITTNALSRRGQVGREFPPYPTYRPAHAWSRLKGHVAREVEGNLRIIDYGNSVGGDCGT